MAALSDNSGAPVPTLPQAINAYAQIQPDRPAIEDEHRRLTWSELRAECVAAARFLETKSIRRLGMVAGNEAGHLIPLIAAASTGVAAVPAARDWPAEEIARRFAAARVDFILCSAGDEARLAAATSIPIAAVSRVTEAGDRESMLAGGNFTDLHLIAPTGGTSGKLKFAHLTHANTVARFITQVMEFGLRRRGRFFCSTPLFHGGGRSFSLCHLYLGGTVILRERFDARQWLAAVRDCTASFIVPTMATRILDVPAEPLPPQLCVVISGAKLDPAVTARWRERLGGTMYNYYGSVEAGAVATTPQDEMLGEGRGDYVGPPAFGVHLGFGAPRPGGLSEIAVRGPGVAVAVEVEDSGLQPTPELNPGDLILADADGGLHHKGRADDVIISGGVNVYPSLVEQIFREIDAIAEVSLLGLPHPEWGEELVLAVAPHPGRSIDEQELRAFARRKLAGASQPKRYHITPDLPLTAAGKIDRRALIARLRPA